MNGRARRLVLPGGFFACITAFAPLVQAQRLPVAIPATPVIVASKPFGESYLLAEMFAQVLEARGLRVDRKPGLGVTETLPRRRGLR